MGVNPRETHECKLLFSIVAIASQVRHIMT